MHVRDDWIKPCNGLYYVRHPATCEKSEVCRWYACWRWGGREFKLPRPQRR